VWHGDIVAGASSVTKPRSKEIKAEVSYRYGISRLLRGGQSAGNAVPIDRVGQGSRRGRLVDVWEVVQVGFPARDFFVVVVVFSHLLGRMPQLLLC